MSVNSLCHALSGLRWHACHIPTENVAVGVPSRVVLEGLECAGTAVGQGRPLFYLCSHLPRASCVPILGPGCQEAQGLPDRHLPPARRLSSPGLRGWSPLLPARGCNACAACLVICTGVHRRCTPTRVCISQLVPGTLHGADGRAGGHPVPSPPVLPVPWAIQSALLVQ